jgi:hypothetical protein
MNTSMFLPQVEEQDVYDADGQQVDDINSIVELINVELGYDKTADDEDDDSGQNFHLVKNPEYSFQQHSVLIERGDFAELKKHTFPEYKMPAIQSVSYDILTPPPELA